MEAPEPRLEPPEEAMARAWDIISGSWWAWIPMTVCTISKKRWFSFTEAGVGGIAVVVPIARSGFGGSVGRRERMWDLCREAGSSKMYFACVR